MSSWNYGGSSSSNSIKDEPAISDIIDEFSFDDIFEDIPHDHEIVQIPTMEYNPNVEV